jgi:hypothetical protein
VVGNEGLVMKKIKRFIAGCNSIIGTTILFCVLMLIVALAFVAINLVILLLYSFQIPFTLFMYVTFAVGIIVLILFFAHCWYLKLRGVIAIKRDDDRYLIYRGSQYLKTFRIYSDRDQLIKEFSEVLNEIA